MIFRNYFFAILTCWFFIVNAGCQQKSQEDSELKPSKQDLVAAMDEYHHILRPLMHQSLPEKDVDAFKLNSAELLKFAEQVAASETAADLGQKSAIDSLRRDFLHKTKVFHETCQSGADDEIFTSFMAAHDAFEALADIVYKL